MMRVPHHLFDMMIVLHIKTLLVTQTKQQAYNYMLSFLPRQHKEENNEQLLVISFYNTMQNFF
jgi:hypothetical protein